MIKTLDLIIPVWRHLLAFGGGILGDRKIVQQTMDLNEPILVFPGGGNEVMRDKHTPRYE